MNLRKVVLVAIAPSDWDAGVSASDADATRTMRCLEKVWEWIDRIAAPPEPRALAAAAMLGRVRVEPAFAMPRPSRGEIGREMLKARVRSGLERIAAEGPIDSVLVVCEPAIFRAIWNALSEIALPEDRPHGGDVGLLTRRHDGRWLPGRVSSDPHPLRAPLERDGIAPACELAADLSGPISPLQIRGERRPTVG